MFEGLESSRNFRACCLTREVRLLQWNPRLLDGLVPQAPLIDSGIGQLWDDLLSCLSNLGECEQDRHRKGGQGDHNLPSNDTIAGFLFQE